MQSWRVQLAKARKPFPLCPALSPPPEYHLLLFGKKLALSKNSQRMHAWITCNSHLLVCPAVVEAAKPPPQPVKSIAASPSPTASVPIVKASPATAADSEPAHNPSSTTPTNGLSRKEKKRKALSSASKEEPIIPTIETAAPPHSKAQVTESAQVAAIPSTAADTEQHTSTTPSDRKKKKRRTAAAGGAEEVTPAGSPLSGAQGSAPSSLFRQLNLLTTSSAPSAAATAVAPSSGQRAALKAAVQAFDSSAAFGSPAEIFSAAANGSSAQKGSEQQGKASNGTGGGSSSGSAQALPVDEELVALLVGGIHGWSGKGCSRCDPHLPLQDKTGHGIPHNSYFTSHSANGDTAWHCAQGTQALQWSMLTSYRWSLRVYKQTQPRSETYAEASK